MGISMRQDIPVGYMAKRTVPETVADDDDDVVVALETARVSEERDDLEAAQKWLHRAAAAARRQGRPDRAGTLSRCAARIGQGGKFERQPAEQQVLGDFDEDEFADKTIVDSAEEIARKAVPDANVIAETTTLRSPPPTPREAPRNGSFVSASSEDALRVAVVKKGDGQFEVRALGPGESPEGAEQEAFLVPVPGGPKL